MRARVYCATCIKDGTVTLTSRRWVYFITDGVGHVKIGFAANVGARLCELQTGNALPLTVLATLKGSCDTERELHQRFAEYRVRGEWFRLAPEVVEYIEAIPNRKHRKVPAYELAQRATN